MRIEDELETIMAKTNDFTQVTARIRKYRLDLAKRLEVMCGLTFPEMKYFIAELRK